MKKLISFNIAILLLSAASFAQPGGSNKKTPQERAELRTQKMTKDLSLTPEQATKVKALFLKQNQEMDSIRAKKVASSDKFVVREDRRAARDKRELELKTILTPEQYTSYQAAIQQRKENHGHGGDDKGNGNKK